MQRGIIRTRQRECCEERDRERVLRREERGIESMLRKEGGRRDRDKAEKTRPKIEGWAECRDIERYRGDRRKEGWRL